MSNFKDLLKWNLMNDKENGFNHETMLCILTDLLLVSHYKI